MPENRTILVAEDEADMARVLKHNLCEVGYAVVLAQSGDEALALAQRQPPDLILLDLRLPGMSGLNVLRELKARPPTQAVPVIIVSALGAEDDIVLGLHLGADDYITKPFRMRELLARVAAALRRGQLAEEQEEVLERGEITINLARREVQAGGRVVALTASEFALLAFMARRPGRVFTRRQLCDHALGAGETIQERTIDAHVRSIRRKLGPAGARIVTLWGVGYKFTED